MGRQTFLGIAVPLLAVLLLAGCSKPPPDDGGGGGGGGGGDSGGHLTVTVTALRATNQSGEQEVVLDGLPLVSGQVELLLNGAGR